MLIIHRLKIGLESFGENLTTLTEEIFGNKEVEKYYKNKIQELIDIGYAYEDIIELLESKDIPLNLNITIYIKNLIEAPNEKLKYILIILLIFIQKS